MLWVLKKNRLIETVLLGTQSICLDFWVNKQLQFYAKIFAYFLHSILLVEMATQERSAYLQKTFDGMDVGGRFIVCREMNPRDEDLYIPDSVIRYGKQLHYQKLSFISEELSESKTYV